MLDTRRAIDTPEGIAIEIATAGPVVRFYAWLIDLFIRGLIYLALAMGLSFLGKLGWGIGLILLFLIEWFYPVLFEVLYAGATPGKKAMGLCVVHDDATPVGWHASVVRNLLRSIDFLPGTYAFGIISMLLNRDFKRLGDLVAGTLVVHIQTPSHNIDPLTQKPQPPAQPLTTEEQQAILNWAQRQGSLTIERSEELARLTSPLVNDKGSAMPELLGVASWIAGRR